MTDGSDLGSRGFANGARYQAARPTYPDAAVAYLVESLGVTSASHVVDLGAGTGIFTEQLANYGPRITAVEPAPGMREVLGTRLSDVRVLDGRDIDIPLASATIDAVFVAQAFHWFDAPRALREIHRVLVPGGGLGLIWNERDESVDWVAELGRAMRWPQFQPYVVDTDFTPVVAAGPFEVVERRQFRFHQVLNHELLMERVLTTSYIAVMRDDERREIVDDVAEVLRALPDPVDLPYVTNAYRANAVLEASA